MVLWAKAEQLVGVFESPSGAADKSLMVVSSAFKQSEKPERKMTSALASAAIAS